MGLILTWLLASSSGHDVALGGVGMRSESSNNSFSGEKDLKMTAKFHDESLAMFEFGNSLPTRIS